MEKYKTKIIIGSGVLAVLIVVGAGLAARSREQPNDATFKPTTVERKVTKDALAKADGKDGHECLVAVNGVVYEIEGFGLWQNGQHATSNGEAYCGADMTEAIGKSPHGRSKLNQLEKIGPLTD